MKTWVISLGGSILAPEGIDVDFAHDFYTLITNYIEKEEYRFIIVVGGGVPARAYQQAYKDLMNLLHDNFGYKNDLEAQDRIGIQATHLNARFILELFREYAEDTIVTNPEEREIVFDKPILIGAGWKPGFSTDLDAVMLANRFDASTIINLSNIAKVYTADPQIDQHAEPLDTIMWEEMRALVGEEWTPGMHAPFDPIASKLAADSNLEVIIALGRDLDNLESILNQEDFYGTKISH